MYSSVSGDEDGDERVNLDVFFNEGDKGRWVPRTILVDLNISDIQQLITEK